MPDTYGGAISRGISQGLGNVSAMYGLYNQVRKAGQEQDLYDIQMKEYQRGQEPADWGKVGDFLDAGEYGKNYAQSYAGALGMDPTKMTRREMKEFGQIFLKDQKAAHDLLTLRRRHYGEKVKEYEGKPDFSNEYKLFKQKFDEVTSLDKEYRAAENYKKTAQSMQEIAQMTDEQLSAEGYVPAIRTIAQSGDVETFGEIMKEVVKAQVKPPTATEFEKYEKLSPEQRKLYDKMKGAGKAGDTFKIGQTRVIQKGNQNITEEYTATGWKEKSRGPKFKPDKPEKPDEIKSIDLSRLNSMIESTFRGLSPEDVDEKSPAVILIKDAARKLGYEFKKTETEAPGALWGTNKKVQWVLEPKAATGQRTEPADELKGKQSGRYQLKDGSIVKWDGNKVIP